MTATSPAVQQAVALLLGRKRELCDELNEITAALNSLGVSGSDLTKSASSSPTRTTRTSPSQRPTIRVAVLNFVNESRRVLSLDEVVAGVGPLFPDRSGDQIRSNVRSALFQLTARGEITKPARGQWGPLNAESPAVQAGLSDLSDNPGKEVIPDGNPAHRDLGPSSGGWLDRGHDHGAPVAG